MTSLSFSKELLHYSRGEQKSSSRFAFFFFLFSSFWATCSPLGHLLLCAACCGYTLFFLFLIPKEREWSQLWFCVSVKIRVSAHCALGEDSVTVQFH